MAKNLPMGDGRRQGAVHDRSGTHRWVKRDTDTGRVIDQKSHSAPFKRVRRGR